MENIISIRTHLLTDFAAIFNMAVLTSKKTVTFFRVPKRHGANAKAILERHRFEFGIDAVALNAIEFEKDDVLKVKWTLTEDADNLREEMIDKIKRRGGKVYGK